MNKIAVFIAIIAVIFAAAAFLLKPSSDLTGFINNGEVFDNFQGKKELEVTLRQELDRRQALIDSLSATVKALERPLAENSSPPEALKIQYQGKLDLLQNLTREYDQEMAKIEAKLTEQVWNQLNTYIKEFGDQRGYDYIFGASGQGNLMYARESKDLSKELIEFINQKYQGK